MFNLLISLTILFNFSFAKADKSSADLCPNSCASFSVKLNNIDYIFNPKTGLGKPVGKEKEIELPSDGDGMETVRLFSESEYYIFTYRFIGMDADNIIAVFTKKDLRLLWSKAISNWNVTPVKVYENSLLVCAHAYIARLKLSDGQIIWEQKNLYEKYKADSFSDIRVQANKLVFTSNVGEFHIKPDSGSLLKTPDLSNRKCQTGMYGCPGRP